MNDFFYDCPMCDKSIFYYGELDRAIECHTILTDRGNKLVCKSHSPADVMARWERGPCRAKNKDGSNCKHQANREDGFMCARHGGGKV